MKKQNYGLKSKLLAMVLVIMLCLTAVPMDTFASLVTTEVKNEDTLKPEESIIDESNNSNESAVGEVVEGEIEAPQDGEVITPPEASPKKIAPIAKIKFVGFEGFSENLEFMPITIILMANGVEIERKAFVLNQEELIFSEQIELDEENNLIEYIFALDENQAKQDGVTVDVTGDTIVVKYEKPSIEDIPKEEIVIEDEEPAENPDGLPGPIEIEGSGFVETPGIFDSEIVRYRAFTMERGSGTMGADGPIIGANHPTTPGEVMLFKQVQEVPGLLNTFEVTLRMEALNNQESNDIVLVIDTSGSMQGDRIANARSAAAQFVNQLLTADHPDTRIALVTFEGSVTKHTGFLNYNDKQILLSAINGLIADGGTYTQGGMHRALTELDGSGDDIDRKQIVLLSDGEPTYSTEINNPDIYLIPYPGYGGQTGSHVIEGDYNYGTRVGDGMSLRWRYYNTFGTMYDRYYNNGNSAIAEAGFAKNRGYTVHTIALGAGVEGTSVLNQMASPDKAYNTNDPTELATIFGTIASDILSAMKNASVSDPMGAGFEVPVGHVSEITVTQGTAAYNLDEKKINWEVGTLDKPVPPDSETGETYPNLKYAELVYRVEINDDILGATAGSDGGYNTNGNATVSYTDYQGNAQTISFPQPTADPLIIELKKVLLDAKGNPIPADIAQERLFNINTTLSEETSYNKDYLIKGNKSRVMTDIKIDGTYTIEENAISGVPITSFDDYVTTLKWDTWEDDQHGALVTGTEYENFKVPRSSVDNEPLDTTFTITNKEKALGKLTITKVVNNTPSSSKGALRAAPVFKVLVVGTNIYNPEEEVYNQEHEIQVGTSLELEGLIYGEYTVTEIVNHGFTPSYNDSEGNFTDGKVKIEINQKEQNVTITNTPSANDAYINYVATKEWVGGNDVDHKAVDLTLLQDGTPFSDVNPTVSPPSGTADQFTYTWANVPKYNLNGEVATYSIAEITPHPYYEVSYPSNYEVVNTFNEDLGPYTVEANKFWVNGPFEKPDTYFTLYRKIGTGPEEIVTVDAYGTSVASTKQVINNKASWEQMPRNDGNVANPYTYFVKETDASGNDATPTNYIKTENGLTVTNTYKSPLTDDLIANKTWVNGPTTKPQISFELWRSGGTAGAGEMVGTAQEVVNNQVNFGKQDATDINGVNYNYYVQEVGENGGSIVIDGKTYLVVYDGLNVKNTYSPKLSDVVANKIWNGGSEQRPTIGFRLYRGIDGGSVDAVSGAAAYKLASGATEAKWESMPETDDNANPYIYSVKELVADETNTEHFIEGAPENYTKVEEGLKVTNTYVSPKTEVTATKVWVYGPANKPDIWFTLYRKVGAGDEELVVDSSNNPLRVKLSSGTTTHTWTDLDKTNQSGEEYTYLVKETDSSGDISWVPDNYVKSEFDLKVTNFYKSPTNGSLEFTKKWEGDPTVTRPTMVLTLWRKTETVDEAVPGADVKEVNGTTTTASWTDLIETDDDGNAYTFYVKEAFKEDKPSNANWKLGEYNFTANTITNTVVTGEDKNGELEIEKILKNEQDSSLIGRLQSRGTPLEFTVVVTDEYGNETSVQIKAGEVKTLEGLYYGKYTIKETVTHGYTPSYAPTEVTVVKDATTTPKFVVTNTNTGGEGTTVDITLTKEWVNGPKPDTTVELWRKGQEVSGTAIDEKVGEFAANADTLSKEFTGLAKHDPSGREFEYYVKEPNVPANYTAEIEGFKVTNTYEDPIEYISVTGRKIWVGADSQTIEMQLYRNGKPHGSPITLKKGDASYTWTRLLKYDMDNNPYRYTIGEVKVPDGFASSVSQDGLTITNTWVGHGNIPFGRLDTPALIKDDHFAYVEGYPDESFRPDGDITRAEIAAIFARLMVERMRVGEVYHSNYSDVKEGAWYYNYIGYLTKYNVINGYPDGSFRPDNPITRAEFAKVASMFDKLSGGGSSFSDVASSHWAKKYIDSAYNKGWVKGYPDGTFRPERNLSRAETVTIINRMLERYADKQFIIDNKSKVKNYTDTDESYWAYWDIMEASNSHDFSRIANNLEKWLRLRPIY